VQLRLTASNTGESPVVYDVTVASVATQKCDVDQDGDIDRLDTAIISRARGQTALPDDPRDANGDGLITVADVKACIAQCTRASCTTQ